MIGALLGIPAWVRTLGMVAAGIAALMLYMEIREGNAVERELLKRDLKVEKINNEISKSSRNIQDAIFDCLNAGHTWVPETGAGHCSPGQ